MKKHKVLITGANGFIGRYLSPYLHRMGYELVHAVRSHQSQFCHELKEPIFEIGHLDGTTQWREALAQVDCIVHLAARVHVMKERDKDPQAAFFKTNHQASIHLAQEAIKAGVRRFIYISSIKVNGEHTATEPFLASDNSPNAGDYYALSKYQAEQDLLALNDKIEIVIIRPPLVYGPGVKGNFERLIKLIETQLPLPLAKINNQRSLLYVENLASLIASCIEHPKANGEVFLASDGEDISTSQLFSSLAKHLNLKARLFYFPKVFLMLATTSLGKHKEYKRLFGSLHVDIEKNKELLNWQPPVQLQEGLRTFVEAYIEKKNNH